MGSTYCNTMLVLPLLAVLLSTITTVTTITCYSCKQDKVVNNSCTVGQGRTEWCKDSDWCSKTWRNDQGVTWGCAEKGPEDEYEGCTTETRSADVSDTVCYCNTDLCNSSAVPTLHMYVAIMCLIIYSVTLIQ